MKARIWAPKSQMESVINSELSKHLQIKYDHELCSSRKCFLHDHIIEDLNCKLVGGMLAETINIADGIRAPTLTTFQENFAAWEKTLKAFQALLGSYSFRNFQLNGRGDENSN
ncbi:hypothetical protein NC652_013758 [Populus alba x Populus x berolinensis]|nr:hypothetical protein NC652_013758 [Populus alba x Populus x berolinensis]